MSKAREETKGASAVGYRDCSHCNGSGIDDSDWSGRCPFCNGNGEVEEREEDYDDDADDDEANDQLARGA